MHYSIDPKFDPALAFYVQESLLQRNAKMEIITNNVPRPVLYWDDLLSKNERSLTMWG